MKDEGLRLSDYQKPKEDYTVRVWDCTWYLTDKFDNIVRDAYGNIQLFHAPELDHSVIAEYPDLIDLKEINSES